MYSWNFVELATISTIILPNSKFTANSYVYTHSVGVSTIPYQGSLLYYSVDGKGCGKTVLYKLPFCIFSGGGCCTI